MREYIVDTNYLLRYLLEDNPTQLEISTKTFKSAKNGEIILKIPIVVFIEVNYTLIKVYKLSKEEVVSQLMRIVNIPYLEIEEREVLLSAFILYEKTNFSLSDLLLLAQADFEGKELLTFDRKLQKLSKSIPRRLS